jgi:hypothetical protein
MGYRRAKIKFVFLRMVGRSTPSHTSARSPSSPVSDPRPEI